MIIIKSKQGIEVKLEEITDWYDGHIEVEATFFHPLKKRHVTETAGKIVCEYQGRKGFHILSSNPKIFVELNEAEQKRVEKFFEEISRTSADNMEHWIAINLGVCFRSDYNCHYWRGDMRTPIEQILRESEEILACCHKKHTTETLQTINEAIQEKQAKIQADKIWQEQALQNKQLDEKGVVRLLEEISPNEKDSGRYLIINKVIKKEDFQKIHAYFWDSDFLDECDMFNVAPGWRITAEEIAKLQDMGYLINIKEKDNK